MTSEEIIRRLSQQGLTFLEQRDLPDQSGLQLRFTSGVIVNVHHGGKIRVQGKNAQNTSRLLNDDVRFENGRHLPQVLSHVTESISSTSVTTNPVLGGPARSEAQGVRSVMPSLPVAPVTDTIQVPLTMQVREKLRSSFLSVPQAPNQKDAPTYDQIRGSLEIHNDEPTTEDGLNRKQFAEAFASLAETCATPLVIGLYGSWGVGKTSLMRLIGRKLNTVNTRTVWFDPWMHQFDENPALSLVHTMIDSFKMGGESETKKLLTTISMALTSGLLKTITNISTDDIQKIGAQYEEERFQAREARVRLAESFRSIIRKAMGQPPKRIVFFVDDLDRCAPAHVLSTLEAIKLYLNVEGCVYFIGVDREAVEYSIRHHYKDLPLSEASYLDKIVQLPFTIPPVAGDAMDGFLDRLLPKELSTCRALLIEGLGRNPRSIKRFVNTLILNHKLAAGLRLPSYEPRVLAFLLLIQYRSRVLHEMIANHVALLSEEKKGITPSVRKLYEEFLAKDEILEAVVKSQKLPSIEVLADYVTLTRLTGPSQTVESTEPSPRVGKKLRVFELAKELNLERSDVIRELQHMGVPVTSHSNTVEGRLADQLRRKFKSGDGES
jgi:hypothetical protein